jgi:hypothetical protein
MSELGVHGSARRQLVMSVSAVSFVPEKCSVIDRPASDFVDPPNASTGKNALEDRVQFVFAEGPPAISFRRCSTS